MIELTKIEVDKVKVSTDSTALKLSLNVVGLTKLKQLCAEQNPRRCLVSEEVSGQGPDVVWQLSVATHSLNNPSCELLRVDL